MILTAKGEIHLDKNRKKLTFLLRILVLAWMLLIFCFSAADGTESSDTSHSVGRFLGRIFVSGYSEMSEEEQLEWADKIDYPIRKCAHASEYAVLALLMFGALGEGTIFDRRKYTRYLFSFLFTAMYACTDEFHQTFVPGRAGTIFDVGVDSAGAAAGLCILWLVKRQIEKKHSRKCTESDPEMSS